MAQKDKVGTKGLLHTFIEEYIKAKDLSLHNTHPLYAAISRLTYLLKEEEMLDSHTSHILQSLTKNLQEPMKVAIIGQFSSGKSTFLNALLGQSILPSGITPITAKVCHIVYGADYALEITYKNAKVATKPIAYLAQVDESENAKIAFYTLYAPLELLKTIHFLDTPGFNSLNQSDTDTTNDVLENVDGIIWLTLIDNVGKQSEKDVILSHIKRYASKSLCVLNQKDRLKNQAEIDASLEYAKKAFDGLFEDIVAISAKDALDAHTLPLEEARALRADSHIESVIDFLHHIIAPQAKMAKNHTVCVRLRAIALQYARLSLHASLRFQKLETHLKEISAYFSAHFAQSHFYMAFAELFEMLDSHLESLSAHIYNALEKKPQIFIHTQKTFGLKRDIQRTKHITTLPHERLMLQLCNADSHFLREFTKLSFDINAFSSHFASLLQTHTESVQKLLTQWWDAFFPALANPLLQKQLDTIIEEYDNLAQSHSAEIRAQFTLFATMIKLNYPLTIALCLNTISLKIEAAKQKHSQNPDMLPLFHPSLENIRDELNMGMCFGFLQENLLTQPLHKKALWHFEREEKALCEKQCALIATYKERYTHHFVQLLDFINELKRIDKT